MSNVTYICNVSNELIHVRTDPVKEGMEKINNMSGFAAEKFTIPA